MKQFWYRWGVLFIVGLIVLGGGYRLWWRYKSNFITSSYKPLSQEKREFKEENKKFINSATTSSSQLLKNSFSQATFVNKAQWESIFSYPYPLSWVSGNITYSLTRVILGDIIVPPDPYMPSELVNRDLTNPTTGKAYRVGEKVYALILYFKLSAGSISGSSNLWNSVYFRMRIILNEEGDMQQPSNLHFGKSMNLNTTEYDFPVIFVVSREEKQFLLMTGETPNIYFNFIAKDDGTLLYEKIESAPEQ